MEIYVFTLVGGCHAGIGRVASHPNVLFSPEVTESLTLGILANPGTTAPEPPTQRRRGPARDNLVVDFYLNKRIFCTLQNSPIAVIVAAAASARHVTSAEPHQARSQ